MVYLPHMERELCRRALPSCIDGQWLMIANTSYYYGLLANLRLQLSLTSIRYRRNNIYSFNQLVGRAYGQTQEARSETAGTQAHRHPQPVPGCRLRRFVSREPVLRPQRPAASALRDAATPPRRRPFNRRCSGSIRRLSPNFLSGTSGFRTCWPDGSDAQATRPAGRSQAFRRSNRACAELEAFLAGANHYRMRQGDQREVRDRRSPSQPRTGAAGQKKTPQVEGRFLCRLVPARPTSYCANEWRSEERRVGK